MVQILGSAHGWKAWWEGWAEEVSLLGDRAFAEPLRGRFILHLALCRPSPFPQSWGEQDGKLSLLDCVFPFWDMLSLRFCQYNVQCLSHPSTRELHWFWWEKPLNVRGRDGGCISVSLTTIKCLRVQPSGRGRYLCLWIPPFLAHTRQGVHSRLPRALAFHKKTFVFYDVDLKKTPNNPQIS